MRNQNENHTVIDSTHAEPNSFTYIINNEEALEICLRQYHHHNNSKGNVFTYSYDAFASPKGDRVHSHILRPNNIPLLPQITPNSNCSNFFFRHMKVVTWNAGGVGRGDELYGKVCEQVLKQKPHVFIMVGIEEEAGGCFEGLKNLNLGLEASITMTPSEEEGYECGGMLLLWNNKHLAPASTTVAYPNLIHLKMAFRNTLPQSHL